MANCVRIIEVNGKEYALTAPEYIIDNIVIERMGKLIVKRPLDRDTLDNITVRELSPPQFAAIGSTPNPFPMRRKSNRAFI